jgi:peptidoglycan/LPS O-acetylase OafA/YrhL
MKNRLPLGLIAVAVLQVIPLLILPPTAYSGVSPVLGMMAAGVCVLLGVYLLRRHNWSRVATIFTQGVNIIVRILIMVAHAVPGGKAGGPLDWWLLGTCMVSIALSAAILYYMDLPDVQIMMQQ